MPTPPSAARVIFEGVFAEMVRAGLSARPKSLQPAYFYDELGSALFDAIMRLPEYTITRAETRLLEAHGHEIMRAAGSSLEVIELGPGNGEKLRLILQHCANPRVHLIDLSASALESARTRLHQSFDVEVSSSQASFAEGLASLPQSKCRRLVLFLGSNIGNFTPDEAANFLRLIHGSLASDDMLLLGVDLVKAEGKLLAAYDDALGVTAAFNRNILVRINRELGANFDILAFDHRALWNADASRIEMHLVSLFDQNVHISALKQDVPFLAGETIWTESSYKYTVDAFRKLVEKAGFRYPHAWLDEEHGFLEILVTV
jgi:L-histidine N-alpha-methyltransferase